MLMSGRGWQEDVAALSENHQFWHPYWESKRVDFSRIKIPTYVLASYSTMLHTVGSVRAYREIATENKWLRIHPHQEWYEDYLYSSVDDLDRFFERYLKGKQNGWENTPRVRVSMYRFGEQVSGRLFDPRSPYSKSAQLTLFCSTLSTIRLKRTIPSREQGTKSSI